MKSSTKIKLLCLSIVLIFSTSQCKSEQMKIILCYSTISGTVWDDADKDGIMADGEDRVAGVEVQLLNRDGEILTNETTNSSGYYEFDEVEGSAEIKVIPPPGKAFTKQGDRLVFYESHVDKGGFSGLISFEECNSTVEINAGLITTMEETPVETEDDTIAATSTYTPIPEGTQCGSVDVPVSTVEEYTTEDGLTIKVHLILRGADNNWIGYLPWVRGDGSDWGKKLDMYFEGEPINVMALTYPGCEGGCRRWQSENWIKALEFYTTGLWDHPCVAPEAKVTLWGSSIGADLALMYCPLMPRCVMTIAFSPNGFIDPTLQAELNAMISAMLPAFLIYGETDPEMSFLNTYTAGSSWMDINGFSETTKDGFNIFKYIGSKAHGDDLYKENFIILLKARIFIDY